MRVAGRVQGVGFRPYVARLARELDLAGWVRNCREGVELEALGAPAGIETLLRRLPREAPPGARIDSVELRESASGASEPGPFRIEASVAGGGAPTEVPPDRGPCADCLEELTDASSRRYGYPFITCAVCGPRDSIAEGIPFDRARTTMADFPPCDACRIEYGDRFDRRFHAETVSCPACGPRVELWDARGGALALDAAALELAGRLLRGGEIVAVKGIGGYQIAADARNEAAVAAVRRLKGRPTKPLAVLVRDRREALRYAVVAEAEGALLESPEAPIVLLSSTGGLAAGVAPGLDRVGLLLPASPLHYRLREEMGGPLVLTSGNRSDEPLAITEEEALARLRGCRAFLVHDRRIARPLDDSVARIVAGAPQLLRRARGYGATAVAAPVTGGVLAWGAHLKGAAALTGEGRIWVGSHVGDLGSSVARERAGREAERLAERHGVVPRKAACDRHPDYGSTRLAECSGLPVVRVQHHVAHAWACAAEHGLRSPWIALAWDGSGLGDDGALWGGEVFRWDGEGDPRRIAHLRSFRLPPKAERDPRRAALGLLDGLEGDDVARAREELLSALPAIEQRALAASREGGLWRETTSAGRLFDAVAALLGRPGPVDYEGQAAMELETWAARAATGGGSRPSPRLDWEPLVRALLEARAGGTAREEIALAFHGGLVDIILSLAERERVRNVLLTGGVFQNLLLLERAARALEHGGFLPLWPRDYPPNDGGIALGQAMAAGIRWKGGASPCA